MKKRARIDKRVMLVLGALVFIFLVILVSLAVVFIKKYTPTSEKVDLNQYFNVNSENEFALVMQDELLETKGMLADGAAYIDYDTVKKYLNSRFYWDSNENVMIYTTPTEIIRAGVGSKEYSISKDKSSEDYVIVKTDGSKTYIAIDFVQKYTNMDYKMFEKPNHMQITNVWGETKIADLKGNSEIRYRGGIKSKIVTEAKSGQQIYVLEEGKKWSKIRTQDGFLGYVKNGQLDNIREEEITREFNEPEYTSIVKNKKVNLAWHQVTSQESNDKFLSTMADTKGLNTISPTWFALSDNEGNISSLANSSYVNYAHQLNMDVWALVDNFKSDVDTGLVLSFSTKREKLTNSLVAAAIENDIDGINVDFESIKEEDAEAFIQFIRELSVKCRINGLVLSIDNYVPTYTAHYNRKEQGAVADYVIIMGYDEHFGGSKESGSVASIGFVEDGIKRTLEEVPKEKVINGIPLYTRLWKETPKSAQEIADQGESADASIYNVTSEALGMDQASSAVSSNGATPVWDEQTGQYYAEYQKDGATYKIWLEEEASIEEKMKLIKKYDLGGVASWKLGFERKSIWDVILRYVN